MDTPEGRESGDYSGTKIRRVNWTEDLDLVRGLLQDYRNWLADHAEASPGSNSDATVALSRIDREIAGLPGVYGPPHGEVVIAFDPEGLAACGSLRQIEPGLGEINRVHVRADHRGPGFGPVLTGAVLDRARDLGYERVRVDALPTMYAAIEFYQAMGFTPIPPYRPHPVKGALFFEYRMGEPKSPHSGP